MSDDKKRAQAEAEVEREIRKERKFSLAEAIGRMAGPGAMKGASPITRLQQAGVEIENWMRHHMAADGEELQTVLLRRVKESEVLLANFERPLSALAAFCQRVLGSEYQLMELVRETDVEWGRVLGEKPYFESAGAPPQPDDPYTLASVRKTLASIIEKLSSAT